MLNPVIRQKLHNDLPILLATGITRGLHRTRWTPRRNRHDDNCEPMPVAIVLSGCGFLDGSEISETMSATFHICQKGMIPTFYAPDVDICKVIDHYTQELDRQGFRNALIESARLARSKVKPLCECEACTHGGLVIPGGFGAVRVLSNFAEKGSQCTVLSDLEKLIEDFSCEKKPIGTMCISSVLVARVLKGVKVTLGKDSPPEDWPYCDAIGKVEEMGGRIEMKDVRGVTRCKKFNVFSTPAWLYKCATYAEIHGATGKMISMMKKCMNQ